MKNCKLTVLSLFSGVVILWIVIFRLGYISISKPHTSSKHTKQSKQQSKQTTTEKGGGASGSEIEEYIHTLERVMSELEKSVSSCYRLNDYHDKYHKMYNNLKEKSQLGTAGCLKKIELAELRLPSGNISFQLSVKSL